MATNSLLPEGLPKEMKTEDEILAQLRSQSQNVAGPQKIPFEQPPMPPTPASKPEVNFPTNVNMAPNLEDLHKLIQEDSLKDIPLPPEPKIEEISRSVESSMTIEQGQVDAAKQPTQKQQAATETKVTKQAKETEKSTKNKENNITKSKSNKKSKEDKKEELPEVKKEEDVKNEKRSQESSPTKPKKEDKATKKESEKEKKEWIKEGFTIVKSEKVPKDNKKKSEEIKAAEEAERKRREEEKIAAEELKKKKQAEAAKKQQEMAIQQQQRQAAESVAKKAPWSGAVQVQPALKDGLTLAEIQRLEREKKLEQMKEQQHMMQLIAQQQAAALAREQEMQAGLGWAKKKSNMISQGQSLAEIQAEARRQAQAQAQAVATASVTQALDEAQGAQSANLVPWGNTQNGGGFWDTPSTPAPKTQEPPKPAETSRSKKKPQVVSAQKKEVTPAAEFETWCTTVLTSWSTKIDVPTFVGFLKDIESPYEVKDYVKCYLGDSKDSNDFARQFLERRSKLLRVGMVTPSDDLSSPAIAVIPRTTSGSDYQEVKSKGKKTKKNKMMKVDAARLLGFSVTAAEDRINVGDIDTV